MRRWLVGMVGVVACDRSEPARPTASEPPRPAVAPADAAAVAEPPPDATVVQPLPPELAYAPVWIYRELQTGAIRGQHTLATHTLRFEAKQAILDIELQTTTHKRAEMMPAELVGWQVTGKKRYVGTVEQTGKNLRFVLAHATEPLELPCKKTQLAVAAADAVRRPHPRKANDDGCGDRGRWVPAATKRVEALSCVPIPKDERDGDRVERMAFGLEPGIEFLYVNDDCVMQGGGYRAIGRGGAIGKIR